MNFFTWIKELFSKAISKFVELFKQFIDEAFPVVKQIIIGKLSAIATKTVATLATTDLSNEEKRNEAFRQILDYAKAEGLTVGSSLINAIIEVAYQKYKNEVGE